MPSALAIAIAQAEGFGNPGAKPTRLNNPGDITSGGQIKAEPSVAAGWADLDNQLALISSGQSSYYSPDMTLAQIGDVWANGDPNWAVNVASALGVTTDTTFAEAYQGGSPVSLASPTAIFSTAASAVETGFDTATGSSLFESLGPMGVAFVAVGAAVLLGLILD